MLHRNTLCAFALLSFSGFAAALEIGFDGYATASASDNVTSANAGSEIEGGLGLARIGIFGEQKGTIVSGGFSGSMNTQRRLDDSDANFRALTEFVGAAEIKITPRSFTWYVGNVLGGVRDDNALQTIDEEQTTRRNVFVTGPRFEYNLGSFNRLNARFLYVNQTQNDVELETLYNTSAGWEFDTTSGNTWGLQLSNIFTDQPEESGDADFNRFSLSGTWARDRGTISYQATLGGTRYEVDRETLDGANASFTLQRQMSLRQTLAVTLSRDLRDQTLSSVETLLDDGTSRQATGNGFFDATNVDIDYNFNSSVTSINLGIGTGSSEFRLLSNDANQVFEDDTQDQRNISARGLIERRFTSRSRALFSVSYEDQDFINTPETTQSVIAEARFLRQLSQSFEAEIGYRVGVSDGTQLSAADDDGPSTTEVDVTENRFTIGIRWAPPTRATRDLTIELQSLLQ